MLPQPCLSHPVADVEPVGMWVAFAPNGHEPRLLVARETRWAEVTLHLEEPSSGDVIAPGVEIEEAAREDLSAE